MFFSYDGYLLKISSWWWTLPVATVPLTAVVLYVCFMWYRARLNRDRACLEERRAELERNISRPRGIKFDYASTSS